MKNSYREGSSIHNHMIQNLTNIRKIMGIEWDRYCDVFVTIWTQTVGWKM